MSISTSILPRRIRALSNNYKQYQAKNVPIVKILDYEGGNSGLTEEKIYQKILMKGEHYSVLSASTEQGTIFGKIPMCTINNKPLKIFENEDGILVSRVGVGSGTTTYLKKGRYAITENAYILFLKKDCPYKVSLRWLMIQYYEEFFEHRILSEYGVWNVSHFFDNMEIDIPSFDEQIDVVKKYDKLKEFKTKIDSLYSKILSIKDKILAEPYVNFIEKNVSISKILAHVSGNSGLTEEFLYSQIQNTIPKDYRVLTGSVNFTQVLHIGRYKHPKQSNKLINVVDGKPVIHVARKGKAGMISYLEKGKYTTNDDAYLLYVRDEYVDKIDLKWLIYRLKPVFFEYSSSADNGTWNMTGFFKNVIIDIPSHDEQKKVVSKYKTLEELEQKIVHIKSRVDELSI